VRVPSHWQVEVSGTPVLGGIEYRLEENKSETVAISPDAPILHINATAVLGGIEIHT
jgi:hypothetical protein